MITIKIMTNIAIAAGIQNGLSTHSHDHAITLHNLRIINAIPRSDIQGNVICRFPLLKLLFSLIFFIL